MEEIDSYSRRAEQGRRSFLIHQQHRHLLLCAKRRRCTTMHGLMWQFVCRQFLKNEGGHTTDWPPWSPNLNPIMFRSIRCRIAPQTVPELSDAEVQMWEDIPLDTICLIIRNMRPYCQTCIQARRGHINYWVPFWVAIKFWQNRLSRHFFHFWLSGVFEYNPL